MSRETAKRPEVNKGSRKGGSGRRILSSFLAILVMVTLLGLPLSPLTSQAEEVRATSQASSSEEAAPSDDGQPKTEDVSEAEESPEEEAVSPEESPEEDSYPDEEAVQENSFRAVPRMARAPQAPAEEGTGLGNYLTSVETYLVENGVPVKKTSTFQDGETALFIMRYKLPAGIHLDHDTLTYHLDHAIVIPENGEEGDETDSSGAVIGHYWILEDGTITMHFDKTLDPSVATEGWVEFTGMVKNTSGGDKTTIDFHGKGTLTITPHNSGGGGEDPGSTTDIQAKKELTSYDKKTGILTYRVVVSSQKGTGQNKVSVSDNLQSSGIKIPKDSFYNMKVTKNGAPVTGYSYTDKSHSDWHVWAPDGFYIKDLPALGAGESYELTYQLKTDPSMIDSVNGEASVTNSVNPSEGDNPGPGGGVTTALQKRVVEKNGQVVGNRIDWTIIVDKRTGDAYTLKDNMTDDKGNPVALPSDFQIRMPDGQTRAGSFGGGSYQIQGPAGRYVITYSTPLPAGDPGQQGQVSNKVTVTDENNKENSVTPKVDYTKPDYGLTKIHEKETDMAGGKTLTWKTTINLPETGLERDKLVYTDTITTTEVGEGTETPVDQVHYTTARLLGTSLTYSAAGGENGSVNLTSGSDFRIFDPDGRDITGRDSDDHIGGFSLELTESGLQKIKNSKAASLELHYQTEALFDMGDGVTWKFRNRGAIPNHNSDTEYRYRKPEKPKDRLRKMASETGNNGSFRDDGLTVDYKNGKIYYRVLLTMSQAGDIVMTDQIPEGLTVSKDDVRAQYYRFNDQGWIGDPEADTGMWVDGKQYFASSSLETSVSSGNLLTVRIPQENTFASKDVGIVVSYPASITDPYWDDFSHREKLYRNVASWKGLKDETETKVTHREKSLDKKARLLDKNGTTQAVEYTITINPQGADLDKNSETITIKDGLTIESAGSDAGATLDVSTLKMYEYDVKAADHKGNPLNKDRYSYKTDPKAHTFELTMPDSLAVVLEYQYKITMGTTAPTLKNTAEIAGVAESKDDTTQKLTRSSSSAGTIQQSITVHKVDSQNYQLDLPNVEFALEKWNKTDKRWDKVYDDKPVVSTGAKGEPLVFDRVADSKLAHNVIYRLTEKKNPNIGYQDVSGMAPYYFLFKQPGLTEHETFQEGGGYLGAGADMSKIQFVRYAEAMYVPNDYKAIRVQKVWLNADNTDQEGPHEPVTVTLYRTTDKLAASTVNIHIRDTDSDKTRSYLVATGKPFTLIIGDNGQSSFRVDGRELTKASPEYRDGKYKIDLGIITGDRTVEVFTGENNWWAESLYMEVGYTKPTDYVHLDGSEKVTADKNGKPIQATVQLSEANHWEYIWENLPAEDGNMVHYHYHVEEDSVPGYQISYSKNNEGITSGTITVSNKRDESQQIFELPSSGGRGSFLYYLVGLTILFGSFVSIKKRIYLKNLK